MKTLTIIISLMFSIGFAMAATAAEKGSTHGGMKHDQGQHATMDHGTMDHRMTGEEGEASGVGVIHRVSRLNRMVNLTHEPIPALNWPEMTMDLPVAKAVDLQSLKPGDKVTFHLKLDEDKKYVITRIAR